MLILSPGELQIRPNAQIALRECCFAQDQRPVFAKRGIVKLTRCKSNQPAPKGQVTVADYEAGNSK